MAMSKRSGQESWCSPTVHPNWFSPTYENINIFATRKQLFGGHLIQKDPFFFDYLYSRISKQIYMEISESGGNLEILPIFNKI